MLRLRRYERLLFKIGDFASTGAGWPKILGRRCRGWLEFAGVENDGLEIDGVEQEQTYIGLLHPMKNFSVYDM